MDCDVTEGVLNEWVEYFNKNEDDDFSTDLEQLFSMDVELKNFDLDFNNPIDQVFNPLPPPPDPPKYLLQYLGLNNEPNCQNATNSMDKKSFIEEDCFLRSMPFYLGSNVSTNQSGSSSASSLITPKYIYCGHKWMKWEERYNTAKSAKKERPHPPQPVELVDIRSRSARVRWTAPKNGNSRITSYTIEYWSSPGGHWRESVSSSVTSCMLRGLKPHTTYTFHVWASNDIGDSKPSQQSQFTTAKEGDDVSKPCTLKHASSALAEMIDENETCISFWKRKGLIKCSLCQKKQWDFPEMRFFNAHCFHNFCGDCIRYLFRKDASRPVKCPRCNSEIKQFHNRVV